MDFFYFELESIAGIFSHGAVFLSWFPFGRNLQAGVLRYYPHNEGEQRRQRRQSEEN